MECPQCGAPTSLKAERCPQCNADLFAAPPSKSAGAAVFLLAFGGWLFVALSMMEQRAVEGRFHFTGWGGSDLVALLYVFLGKWPPVIVAWLGASAFTFRAWRERLSEKRWTPGQPDSRIRTTRTGVPTEGTPANVAPSYRVLGTLIVLVAAASSVLRSVGIVPILQTDTCRLSVALDTSLFAVALIPVAFLIKLRRLPRREPGTSVEEYWSMSQVSAIVSLFWLLLEGAGMIAAVGYLLTGEQVSAITMAFIILVFWLCRPSEFAKI